MKKTGLKNFLTRTIKCFLIASLSGTLIVSSFPATAEAKASQMQSFNEKTGILEVDYASYLAKHDVVYRTPVTNPADGATVGNGKMGAVIWNQDGLTMQVTTVDASPYTCFSQGLIKLNTTPGLDDSYTEFEQRTNLYDGLVTVQYDENRTITIFGDESEELLAIHVKDEREEISEVSLDLQLWDTITAANSDLMHLDTYMLELDKWKNPTLIAEGDIAAFSRGVTDDNGYGYTLAASADGASAIARTVDERTVRLEITPNKDEYTIWIACPSKINTADGDTLKKPRRFC